MAHPPFTGKASSFNLKDSHRLVLILGKGIDFCARGPMPRALFQRGLLKPVSKNCQMYRNDGPDAIEESCHISNFGGRHVNDISLPEGHILSHVPFFKSLFQ